MSPAEIASQADSEDAVNCRARLTLFTKLPAGRDPTGVLLSKRIGLVDGQVVSDGSPCRMATGTAETVSVATASDLSDLIARLGSDNALALGCIKDHHKAQVVTARVLRDLRSPAAAGGLPIIARSREFIDYGCGPAWLLIDFDKKGMPADVSAAVADAGGVWEALVSIAPGLAQAARVTRSSTSSGLRRVDTGDVLSGSGGEHHYLLAADGTDVDRALVTLHDLCWLRGLGWYCVGATGQLLERSIVDRAVGFGERLIFEGRPEIAPPLVQDAAARTPIAHDGGAIDTQSVIPDLTDYQVALLAQAKRRARSVLEPLAAKTRAEADHRLAKEIGERMAMPFTSAMRAVAARHHGTLLPQITLDFDHSGIVTVKDVLADPDNYVGETLADPLEGASYGRCKAIVLRSKADPEDIFISSFAHGRGFYRLRHDAQTAKAAIELADPTHVVDVLCAIIRHVEIEADERAALVAAAAAKAGTGVRAIEARLREELKHRVAAERERAHQLILSRDNRPTYPLPPPDAERGPIIRLVDDALAADQSEEPPMRDAAGMIVEVHAREPWGLHLLTATGSNTAASPTAGDAGVEGDGLGAPAPQEPMIIRLSAVEVELLIERYIRFETQKTDESPYAAALQRDFICALMAMGQGSKIPVARAINTAPLVAINGNVISGVGLDRDTGLIHRIEAHLLDCLPKATPTEEEVRAALRWLLDEWLVDVNAGTTGRLLALMLCLSMLERVLLKERPAWFVTAGHRGGGKTTLIIMLTIAVFGRMAAAANWSDSAEERRKALFSYLRQSVAVLCWDNIPRGAKITDPSIEKALTSAEVSDRVLGESVFETAPGGTIQVFTGNSIGPKGDMCSRSFPIIINVDRPDPENREFKHPDPIGWTEQHRRQILKCFYTILIFGCRNRPVGQIAKTRFKDWCRSVAGPSSRPQH